MKVTVRKGDAEFALEDLTFEQVKELVGVNGYGHAAPAVGAVAPQILPRPITAPDFAGFYKHISDRGRTFVNALRQHPQGMDAHDLAKRLDYKDPRQIGGLTGGGLAKIAKRFRIKLEDVYRTKITFPDNKRTVTFFPSKWIIEWMDDEEKHA